MLIQFLHRLAFESALFIFQELGTMGELV